MVYHSPLPPKQHQVEARKRLLERPRNPSPEDVFAWLMDMGTGKTKVVLDEWGERVMAGELSDLLVIAPRGSYRNWDLDHPEQPSEITKHLDPELRAKVKTAAWQSNSSVAKREVDELIAVRNGPRILNMNVEALSYATTGAREAAEAFLRTSRHGTMICVDESTRIKNYKAKRTKWIQSLGRLARARRIATGLVTPRSPLDLYSQFEFLDPRILGCKNFWIFRARYAIIKKLFTGGRYVDVVVGYRNVEDLNERIAPYSYRVTKEECLDLEPKVYESWEVELTGEQQRLYTALKDEATVALDEVNYVTATVVITQILRLHQVVCGHAVNEHGHIHDVPENRTAAVLEILEDHDGKAVIWVNYDYTLRRLYSALVQKFGEGSVARFWGGNTNTRGEEEQRFKTDPRCRFMIATPGAGGIGNNWVVANLVIYYSNSYDLELRSQSEDRSHRIGQDNKVTYIDLVARGTVDEKILLALRRKINLATTITGENFREWII